MRKTKLVVMLGFNGTGKTTLLKEVVSTCVNAGQKALIVVPDSIEWSEYDLIDISEPLEFKGARRVIFEPSFYRGRFCIKKGTLPCISDNYNDGLLIFDDCRSYVGFSTEMDLRGLLIRRRQKMLDVFAVAHGFTEVPPAFFTYASEFILFQTKDNISRRAKFIQEFYLLEKAQAIINKEAEKNPYYYEIIKV
jgi:hypothetical protein